MAFDPSLVIPKRLASLPAAGAFVGDLVVLKGTGVIYRWSGSAWVGDGSGGGGGGLSLYDAQVRLFYAP